MHKQLLLRERPDTTAPEAGSADLSTTEDAGAGAVERLHRSMLCFAHRLQASGRRWWQPVGELTRSELHVLRVISEHGECRSKEIAAELEIGPGAVSRQLAALGENGMVERRRDPDDGRAELVRLTPRGEDALATDRAAYLARLRQQFGDWEPLRLEAAAELIDQLSDLLTTPAGTGRSTTHDARRAPHDTTPVTHENTEDRA